jgi:hypothetical protein
MCLQPEHTSRGVRVDTGSVPPRRFITTAMDLAMMASTQRNGKLVADFAAKRP